MDDLRGQYFSLLAHLDLPFARTRCTSYYLPPAHMYFSSTKIQLKHVCSFFSFFHRTGVYPPFSLMRGCDSVETGLDSRGLFPEQERKDSEFNVVDLILNGLDRDLQLSNFRRSVTQSPTHSLKLIFKHPSPTSEMAGDNTAALSKQLKIKTGVVKRWVLCKQLSDQIIQFSSLLVAGVC